MCSTIDRRGGASQQYQDLDPRIAPKRKRGILDRGRNKFWRSYYQRQEVRLKSRRNLKESSILPVLIINFNRLTWPREMVRFLERIPGTKPVILDNASTYLPLLDWYKAGEVEVIRLRSNLGHLAPWSSGIVHTLGAFYAVTDPDLDLSSVPSDFVDVLKTELRANRHLRKVGLSLRIDDLPVNQRGTKVRAWESQFWESRSPSGFYEAQVDTTFAVYAAERVDVHFLKAHRSPPPYTARHLPWYPLPPEMEEEERYYQEHVSTLTHWALI